jgi:hypothetical protein
MSGKKYQMPPLFVQQEGSNLCADISPLLRKWLLYNILVQQLWKWLNIIQNIILSVVWDILFREYVCYYTEGFFYPFLFLMKESGLPSSRCVPPSFQLLNQLTSFYEIYVDIMLCHINRVLFNFVQSVISRWRTHRKYASSTEVILVRKAKKDGGCMMSVFSFWFDSEKWWIIGLGIWDFK